MYPVHTELHVHTIMLVVQTSQHYSSSSKFFLCNRERFWRSWGSAMILPSCEQQSMGYHHGEIPNCLSKISQWMRYPWGFISPKAHPPAKEEEFCIFMEALAHLGALVRNGQVLFFKSNPNLYIFAFRHVSINTCPVLPSVTSLFLALTGNYLWNAQSPVKGSHISASSEGCCSTETTLCYIKHTLWVQGRI